MTDHEMLVFAAKAYGAVWNPGFACFIDPAQPDSMTEGIWLPRTDDGDAFRLMVKLGLDIQRDKWDGQVYAGNLDVLVKLPLGKDHAAATREAIFQAAVAIGKAMP